MAPLLIGFFWELPDIEMSQWTQTCSDYDPAFFFAVMVYYAGGYEYLGAVGGELNFGATKLLISYIVAVVGFEGNGALQMVQSGKGNEQSAQRRAQMATP